MGLVEQTSGARLRHAVGSRASVPKNNKSGQESTRHCLVLRDVHVSIAEERKKERKKEKKRKKKTVGDIPWMDLAAE